MHYTSTLYIGWTREMEKCFDVILIITGGCDRPSVLMFPRPNFCHYILTEPSYERIYGMKKCFANPLDLVLREFCCVAKFSHSLTLCSSIIVCNLITLMLCMHMGYTHISEGQRGGRTEWEAEEGQSEWKEKQKGNYFAEGTQKEGWRTK